MQNYLLSLDQGTMVLLVLSIMLFAGFIMTRLTNTLDLPKVSGYILAGIVIGPYGLNYIPEDMISHMGFVSDIALAFISFGVGKFLKKEVIVKTGPKIICIALCETLIPGVMILGLTRFVFGLDWDLSLLLSAIATATAPASTMMTINQYKAEGEFVDTLLQIIALDNVICLMIFSAVSGMVGSNAMVTIGEIIKPIGYNVLTMIIGVFCGYFLTRLLIPTRSKDNRLILVIAMLLGITGFCALLDISPLLSCMVFGMVYINMAEDSKLYRQINNFTPPVLSLFFILSGMNLDLKALTTVGYIGISYFFVRIIGKYLGAYVSSYVTRAEKNVRNYMGMALIPQARVAIGLAFLGERLLPAEKGELLLTIVLSSSVLYEMIGPICARMALFSSGCIAAEENIQNKETMAETGSVAEYIKELETGVENYEYIDIEKERRKEKNDTREKKRKGKK